MASTTVSLSLPYFWMAFLPLSYSFFWMSRFFLTLVLNFFFDYANLSSLSILRSNLFTYLSCMWSLLSQTPSSFALLTKAADPPLLILSGGVRPPSISRWLWVRDLANGVCYVAPIICSFSSIYWFSDGILLSCCTILFSLHACCTYPCPGVVIISTYLTWI